jgi:hypothetical protein
MKNSRRRVSLSLLLLFCSLSECTCAVFKHITLYNIGSSKMVNTKERNYSTIRVYCKSFSVFVLRWNQPFPKLCNNSLWYTFRHFVTKIIYFYFLHRCSIVSGFCFVLNLFILHFLSNMLKPLPIVYKTNCSFCFCLFLVTQERRSL